MAASLSPQNIDKLTWYYENKKSLTIVREIRDKDGKYYRTEQFNIPIFMLKTSIERIKSSKKAKGKQLKARNKVTVAWAIFTKEGKLTRAFPTKAEALIAWTVRTNEIIKVHITEAKGKSNG